MPNRTHKWLPTYVRWIIRWRWLVLLIALLVTALAGYGLRYLQFTSDYRVYFSEENPQLRAFDALENIYTKTDNLLFVIQPADNNVFNRETLGIVKQLTEDGWRIPHAIRVDSITNFQHIAARGDDIVVADLVRRPEALDADGLARVRAIALNEPALVNRLISANGATAGVFVTLQFPGADHTQHLPASVAHAEELLAGLQAAHPDITAALTGITMFSYAETEVSRRDMATLVPLMYAVMTVAMLLLLRSTSGTAATLTVASFSALTAVGVSAWLGMKMNPSTALAPIVILTLGIADSVHILMTLNQEMRAGRSRETALIESLRVNAEPVFLTSLTTSIGFLSLNFSDTPPFRDLGNISAMGVGAAWAFSMTLLPAMMAILPLRLHARGSGHRSIMERLGNFVVVNRHRLLGIMGGITLAVVAFIPRLELDDRFVQWFDDSLAFRRHTDFASENLTGLYTIEFSIGSGEPGGIAEPAYLERLEAFAQWLRAEPEVSNVSSFTDVMKRLNKALHGDQPDWYRVPQQRGLAAQFLLLYELSLPFGLDLNSQINIDKSATRLTATLKTVPMKTIRAVTERAEDWLEANAPPPMRAQATGLTNVFVHLAERNIRSMLGGTVLAFVLIAATLIVALKSMRIGLLSLVPNILPVGIAFGLWGAFVGQIGIIASMITATSLGLIVDDTVHILSKYHRARREQGLNAHDAIRFSFAHVGNALWVTTATLIAGFMVLALSAFKLNADMGILTSITLASALVMDFLLLPPLLMWLDREPRCECATCRRLEAA